MKNHYKTIVISDLHLGTEGSKAKEATRFLKQSSCENLILNGDIIDGWRLKKGSKWKKKHTRFFKQVIKMMDRDDTKVTYVRGNHDDFLDQIMPFKIGKINIVRDMIYESHGKRYYITHGDVFDSITSNMKWIALLGDIGYTFLLWVNKLYNDRRTKKGLPYYSLSQKIKSKVKSAVSYIDKYEKQLVSLTQAKKCHGIICGHIHQPAIKVINEVQYLNSGDWVESLTALVEDDFGHWKIINYTDLQISKAKNDNFEDHEDEEDIVSMQSMVQEVALEKHNEAQSA